jgi:hypothetical protein
MSEKELQKLTEWLRERVPLYFNYGDKAVAYTWNPRALAEDLLEHAPLPKPKRR